MNKSDLVETLGKETELSKTKAEQAVGLFFDQLAEARARDDRVEIRGFCSCGHPR